VSVSNSSVSFSPWYDQSHATSDTITPEVDSVVQEHRVAMQRLQRVDDFLRTFHVSSSRWSGVDRPPNVFYTVSLKTVIVMHFNFINDSDG